MHTLLSLIVSIALLSAQVRIPGPGGSTAAGGGSAIEFDAKSASAGNAPGAAPSWTHTVGAGCTSNCILIVGLGGYNADPPASCTYNGDGMTLVASNDPGNSATMFVYRLASPDTGANTVTCSSGFYRIGAAFSFNHVNATTPVNQTANASGTGANASGSITPTEADSWVMDFVYWPSSVSPSAPTWSTQTSTVSDGVNTQSLGAATTGPVAASSQTNTWTSSSGAWAAIKVAISPE